MSFVEFVSVECLRKNTVWFISCEFWLMVTLTLVWGESGGNICLSMEGCLLHVNQ